MTKAPDTELTSRTGAYYTGYICSMSGVIFRETPNTDVGIDGQVELVDSENKATGMIAGAQVKSGDTFVDRLDKETAWKRLVTIFFASDSDPDVIADVGYRLS